MTITIDGTNGVTFPAGGVGNTAGSVVGTTDTQSLSNKTLAAGTASVAPLVFTSGTNLTTASVGAMEFDGKLPYFTPSSTQRGVVPAGQYYRLNANDTGGQNIAVQQGIFSNGTSTASSISTTTLTVGGTITGTFAVGQMISGPNVTAGTYITALGTGTGGAGTYTVSTSQTAASGQINSYRGVNLTASTIYQFDLTYFLQKAAGTTSHTVGFGFGGSATLNNIVYGGFAWANGTATTPTSAGTFTGWSTAATSVVWTTGLTASGVWIIAKLQGTVSVNAAGTFVPSYFLSAAPGGAYTTNAGTYFNIYPVGAAGANTSVGAWV
jgi:hypothetical protein